MANEHLEALRSICAFAFEHGFHELGYDPVQALADDIDRLDKKCAALACLQYGSPAEPEAPQRCCCGSQDWPPDTLQIECSRGVLHFLDKPCHHK